MVEHAVHPPAACRFGAHARGKRTEPPADGAGREGFWLHRFLQGYGITNHVVDSSSIEVNRRRRRAKSDGLDVRKLLSMLMRYEQGERHVWQVVKVPAVEAEDQGVPSTSNRKPPLSPCGATCPLQ